MRLGVIALCLGYLCGLCLKLTNAESRTCDDDDITKFGECSLEGQTPSGEFSEELCQNAKGCCYLRVESTDDDESGGGGNAFSTCIADIQCASEDPTTGEMITFQCTTGGGNLALTIGLVIGLAFFLCCFMGLFIFGEQ